MCSNLFQNQFQSSSTTLSTTTQISMEIPVIGAINGACSLENVENVLILARRSQMVGTGHKLIWNLIYHA